MPILGTCFSMGSYPPTRRMLVKRFRPVVYQGRCGVCGVELWGKAPMKWCDEHRYPDCRRKYELDSDGCDRVVFGNHVLA